MANWWPSVVQDLGIERAAGHKEWPGACFFKPKGVASCERAMDPERAHLAAPRECEDVTELQMPPPPNAKAAAWQARDDRRPQMSHNVSSCAKLFSFYTPAVALDSLIS